MKKQTKTTITLTPEEAAEIIAKHFGVPPKNIRFEVGNFDDPDDWRAEYAQTPKMYEVVVTKNHP